MTDEINQIVEWLREDSCGECIHNSYIGECTCIGECRNKSAADLIESLSAELEQVKRERDAAVEDIAELRMKYFPRTCFYCKHHTSGDYVSNDCMDCYGTNWQWRGVMEETHE